MTAGAARGADWLCGGLGAGSGKGGMRMVRIESLIGYIAFIAGLTERAAYFRGGKDPVAIVFAWLQRYLVRGLALGAMK